MRKNHILGLHPSLVIGLALAGCATESTTDDFDPFAPMQTGGSAGAAGNAGGTKASGGSAQGSGPSSGGTGGTAGPGAAGGNDALGSGGSISTGGGGSGSGPGSGGTGSGSSGSGAASGNAGMAGRGGSSGGSFGSGGTASGGHAGTSSGGGGSAGSSATGGSSGMSGAGGTVFSGGNGGVGGTANPVADVLLSLGKPSSADSEEAAKGNVASLGNDGSSSSRWCAADGKAGHYWQVDLGESFTLAKVDVAWEQAIVYKYKIEGSADGTTFVSLVDKTGNTTSTATSSDAFSNAPEARYVRITVTGLPATNTWASFFELSVFGH